MDRVTLKSEAKKILNAHFSFYFLLFLPVFILEFFSGFTYTLNQSIDWGITDSYAAGLQFLPTILLVGLYFVALDAVRNNLTYENPLAKSFTVFKSGEYFLGAILITLLQFIFTFLWSLLFFIPGVIKMMAYSQSFYIYRDAIDHHQQIGFLDAITKSRELMNGHKADYFVMLLSFLGWWLLVFVTAGIAAIWVQPYMSLSFAGYYNELTQPNNQPQSDDSQDDHHVTPTGSSTS